MSQAKRKPHLIGQRKVAFEDWVNGRNAELLTTRADLVAYNQFWLREQLVPVIADCIKAYDRTVAGRKWYNRLRRWLAGKVLRTKLEPPPDALGILRDDIADAKADDEPVAEQAAPLPTCVVCGSPRRVMDAEGKVRCENGHPLSQESPA